MSNSIARQRGSVLVLFAFALFLLFGVLALVIDVGYRTVQKNNLQNAADAAALRGASYIYEDGLLGIFFAPGSTTALMPTQTLITISLPICQRSR